MSWNLQEALDHYKGQGAPSSQTALVNLLKEIQQESGGSIPRQAMRTVAEAYGLKETFLLAIIKRMPTLRLDDSHCLEICCGEACLKCARLVSFVEKNYGKTPPFTVKYGNCMRQCGKGPNMKWDGVLYNHADEALIRKLVAEST